MPKRIIPCLDVKDGRTVKGVNFAGIRDAGDAVELAKRYEEEGADELVFLDIAATVEKRKTLLQLVEKIAINPAKIAGIDTLWQEKGGAVLVDPNHKWTVSKDNMLSQGKNTPFIHSQLTGKVEQVFF